ncbi:MAG: alanine racemase [Lachnospiraceae bacterium]|nr:alanine racemase [Lachnospiraceae bacterium]
MQNYRRTHAIIDLDAIEENLHHMKRNIPDKTKIMGVIKTDGYGHGCVPIAHCLEKMDFIQGFAVATAEEAHILRMAGIQKPILILGYTFPYSYERLIQEEVSMAVFREDTIAQLAEASKRVKKPARVHIKVDTGMSRIGIMPDDSGFAYVQELMKHKEILIEGIFTHFAKADELDKTDARLQYACFASFINRLKANLGLDIPMKHCANSAGIMELPESSMDVVRAGISLYGLYPSQEVCREIVPLKPALSWYSEIVYLKTIHKGQSVSYGGVFTASQDTLVATVPVGYGDGYPRSLTGKGYVLIHGQKAPILGRVCMDQFMVDVTQIANVAEGDRVTLLGRDGGENISAELLGELSGRFNYELVCDIGKRVPRVYLYEGKVVASKDYHNDCE